MLIARQVERDSPETSVLVLNGEFQGLSRCHGHQLPAADEREQEVRWSGIGGWHCNLNTIAG